jgi:hypothetical protein
MTINFAEARYICELQRVRARIPFVEEGLGTSCREAWPKKTSVFLAGVFGDGAEHPRRYSDSVLDSAPRKRNHWVIQFGSIVTIVKRNLPNSRTYNL